ncbi:sensor histidine kinase [Fructobacillus sp. W13]|uniref:histidine kinase n=1 Tax=Fructobacillus apis TaxID=2935017 RepID=A0ABT0ZQS6_9LACO|nr:sensor histidine kinase [Fructobacillus apis]MCO0832351.1 sensor histidine kinase [Fructobacillus apis]
MSQENTSRLQRETLLGLRPIFILWILLGVALALYVDFQTLSLSKIGFIIFVTAVQCILIALIFQKVMARQWSMTAQILMLLMMMYIIHGTGSGVLLLTISPILIIQSIIFDHYKWANLSAIALFILVFLAFLIQKSNFGFILFFIEVAVLMLLIVFLFVRSYQRSLQQLSELQHSNAELQLAYNQVDQLSTDRERERIARDLHDTLLQDMTGLSMLLDVLNQKLEEGDFDSAVGIVEKANRLSKETLVSSRDVVSKMREESGQSLQFQNRLKVLTKTFYLNYSLNVQLSYEKEPEIRGNEVDSILKLISEGLMNVVKHSHSDFALLKFNEDELYRNIEIIDFGGGFDVDRGSAKKHHFGMKGMRERVLKLDGTLEVQSTIGEGTTVIIRLPK